MFGLVAYGETHTPSELTVYYKEEDCLCKGIAAILANTRSVTRYWRNAEGNHLLEIPGTKLTLCKESTEIVTDFDVLGYEPRTGLLYYNGEPPSDELLEKFRSKKATLEFDADHSVWGLEISVEVKRKLKSYLSEGWTLLDKNGKTLTFVNEKPVKTELDPECQWIVVRSPALTKADFHRELDTLLAKYAHVLADAQSSP